MTRLSNSGNDLRVFMEQLGEIGEIKAIEGADWNLEIGALTEIGAGWTNSPRSIASRRK